MIVKSEHFDTFLPFGEGLRAVLNSSLISESNLNQLLKNRGVFIQNSNTVSAVDYLVSSIISPSEFDFLREKQNFKEDRLKRSTKVIKLSTNNDLITILPEINSEDLILREFSNYELAGAINIVFDKTNSNKASVDIPIEIVDTSKNWSTSKSIYNVKIEFEKKNDELIINTTSTAPETKDVSEIFTRAVEKKMKSSGYINSSSHFERILFSSFPSNKKRIAFFLSLANTENSPFLEFGDVSKIGIIPATEEKLPTDIEWMATTKNLMLDGDELHKIFFIDNELYSSFMNFYKIAVNYKYKSHFAEGRTEVIFEFPRFMSSRDNNAEFEIKISSIALTEDYKHINKVSVENWLLNKLTDLKMQKFRKIINNVL